MNKFAVYHARARLERARRAVAEMRQEPRTMEDIQRTWFDFLLAANGVFVKLQKGAQNDPESQLWWGKLKQLRKDDELLSYIHHARRVEEHGLNISTQMTAPTLDKVPDDYVVPLEKRGKEIVAVMPWGTRVRTTLPSGIQLVDVVDDQYGDVFPWPKSHMGRPIGELLSENTIPALAELAISALEKIIDEAMELVSPELPQRKPSHGKPPGQG